MEHRDLVRGAAEVEETPEGVRSRRMTAEALELCREYENAGDKAEFSAGVRIALVTDSNTVSMSLAPAVRGRTADYQVDILVDRSECHTFSPEDPDDEFSFTLDLPEEDDDEHEIEIFMPISANVDILSLELDDGALFRPTYCSDERMLILGGAAAMGSGATSPLRSFAALLAVQLDTDCINWSVGNMPLDSRFGELALELEWQKVLVCCDFADYAAGRSAADCGENLAAMLDCLTSRPGVAVYVITPLLYPGKEERRNSAGSTLDDFRQELRRVAETFPGVKLIDGAKLLDEDEDMFDGESGNPSDEGMALIAEKLLPRLS